MSRRRNDVDLDLRFNEMLITVDKWTSSVLNPNKMQLWSFPKTFVHVCLLLGVLQHYYLKGVMTWILQSTARNCERSEKFCI